MYSTTRLLKNLILKVALNVPIDNLFDYKIPSNNSIQPKQGQRIRVPFGKQEKIGFIHGIGSQTKVPASKLKPALKIIDDEPLVNNELLDLISWVANYYHYPIGEVYATAVPLYLRQEKTPKIDAMPTESFQCESHKKLTEEQEQGFKKLLSFFNQRQIVLLDGVTGSGKTELYLQSVDRNLKKNQQVLLLVPEIGLTPQIFERFQKRFGNTVSVVHSGNTYKQRAEIWLKAKQGDVCVVIGTRSAVFTPFKNLGMIIVDEEHDPSFKQQSGLCYSGRNVAIIRAKQSKIPILLGSATPSFESLMNAKKGKYKKITLKQRVFATPLPQTNIIDLRVHSQEQGLTKFLLKAIKKHIENDNQVLLYLNRRGFSPATVCSGCGYIEECPRCDTSMVLHKRNNRLVCHHCNHNKPWEKICTECGSPSSPLGEGTEQIELALKKEFPRASIVRMDRDTVNSKKQRTHLLEQAKSGTGQILLGTQMLTKGHDFPNLSMVAIVNADQGMFGSDFRSSERFAQTFVQVSGRAGRRKTVGEVFLQTYNPKNPLLNKIISQGYNAFFSEAVLDRKVPQWPPYSHLALLHAQSTQKNSVFDFLNTVRKKGDDINLGNTMLLGPVPSPIEKKAGKFRGQLLLLNTNRKELHRVLDKLCWMIKNTKKTSKVKWSLDVDPIDLS